ncbi:jg23085 [Pararge aegeria aegeria]|uniref:Jg23085 protein n=1 Tax=Pararge aegeria aegeria TaxID=348720 RepID=A0A8S4S613_9NEOP|nr:jg23085 [Pararge aegeria aegeria]
MRGTSKARRGATGKGCAEGRGEEGSGYGREQGKGGAMFNERAIVCRSQAALSGLMGAEGPPASVAPPPHALHELRRRVAPPPELHWLLQEVEAWGVRRGGAWGGARAADALLRAVAPLAAHPHAPLRTAALSLLAKLLPAAPDLHPGLQAILECLDSSQPEVAQSAVDKLPELVVGMQEHAARILMRVFELGMKSRLPVEPCIAKCVATINLNRGC